MDSRFWKHQSQQEVKGWMWSAALRTRNRELRIITEIMEVNEITKGNYSEDRESQEQSLEACQTLIDSRRNGAKV